ncbi:MAG: carbonic anhydrase [Planctomycetaceae bacterium]|nr:carbonic anhydrase [Planctomycetaceae bacterium]
MQQLVSGIHQFQQHIRQERPDLLKRLSSGQEPLALFITCSDSRVVPNLMTQTDPGDLFVLQTAGNIIPPYGAVTGGEAATIEYAVAALKVRDIIVCGHSLCGAMSALIEPEQLKGLPAVEAVLKHAESTRRIMSENYHHLVEPVARLTATVQENVLVQLENLRTHPSVAAALARGALRLHGWVYKMQTTEVFSYHADYEQFLPLVEDAEIGEMLAEPFRGRNGTRPNGALSVEGAA